jgi:integrase/recombinase XerD
MELMKLIQLDPSEARLAPEVLTFLIAEFIAIKVRSDSENTRKAYLDDLRKLGEFTMGDLSDRRLLAFKLKVIDCDRDGNTRAHRTSNRILSVCRKFLRFLVEKGVLVRNYYDLVDGHRIDKMDSPYVALSDAQVRSMIDLPDRSTELGAAQRLSMILFFYLGLRRAEICSIRPIDILEGVLTIKGKGRKVRRLPLPETLQDEIRSYMDLMALKGRVCDPKSFLLQSRESHGDMINPTTVWRWFVSVAVACGVRTEALRDAGKKISPHSARATMITKALDNGIGIRDVAILAGHNNGETTSIYDKRRGEASKAVVAAIKY